MKRLLCLLLLLTIAIPFTALAQEDATPVYEVFVTEDGAFITLLPDGWVAEGDGDGGLQVANSTETMDAMNNSDVMGPESGQFAMLILPLPAEMLDLFGGSADSSYSEILTIMMGLFGEGDDFPSFGEPIELSGEEYGFDGAYATGSSELTDAKMIVYDLAVGTIGVAVLVAAPGELDNFEAEAGSVIVTASYAPALDESYSNEDAAVEFDYPAGWKADVDENGLVYVTNDPEVTPDSDLQSGQYAVAVINLSAFGLAGDTLEATADNILPLLLDEGDTADDPVILVVGDDEVFVIGVSNEDETTNDGGLVIRDVDGTMYAAVYASAYDEARLIGYTAAAILLSISQ
ncbi:MAG: hypothetical protein H6673_07190 [Anaerolineales bacterium]|nr:hypothetical protein [Anaerolineales bacterium]